MREPVLTPGDEPRKPVSRGWRRWLTVVAVVVIVSGVVTAIAVIARHGDEAGAPATPTGFPGPADVGAGHEVRRWGPA